MWSDYQQEYSRALRDPAFLAWRETGAREKSNNVLRVCEGVRVDSVIEVGCGTGAIIRRLAASNFARKYVGVDASFSAVQWARESSGTLLQNMVVADASYMPFADRTFDVAVLSHVLEHLQDPASAVEAARKIARFLVIEVPLEDVLVSRARVKLLGKARIPNSAGHVQFWSPRSIECFIKEDCQLEIRRIHFDLIDSVLESWGKKGISRIKPVLKGILKSLLPVSVYAWVFTTHVTFLCCDPTKN